MAPKPTRSRRSCPAGRSTWLAEAVVVGDPRAVAAGRHVQRVLVMDNPPTSYQYFELALAPHSVAAGEDLRLLDAQAARVLTLPAIDFWLLDDERAISGPAEVVDDWAILEHLRRARDRALGARAPLRRVRRHPPVPLVTLSGGRRYVGRRLSAPAGQRGRTECQQRRPGSDRDHRHEPR
jgi:hypothetical protein